MKPKTFMVTVSLFFAAAVCSAADMAAEAGDFETKADCNIHKGPCTKKTGSLEVTLDITPKPVSAMRDNSFIVRIMPDPRAEAVIVDLGMPGMYMGRNVIKLRRQAPGLYTESGVIPRCPSGKRLWKAAVRLPEGGKVEYFFDVVY